MRFGRVRFGRVRFGRVRFGRVPAGSRRGAARPGLWRGNPGCPPLRCRSAFCSPSAGSASFVNVAANVALPSRQARVPEGPAVGPKRAVGVPGRYHRVRFREPARTPSGQSRRRLPAPPRAGTTEGWRLNMRRPGAGAPAGHGRRRPAATTGFESGLVRQTTVKTATCAPLANAHSPRDNCLIAHLSTPEIALPQDLTVTTVNDHPQAARRRSGQPETTPCRR